MSLFFFYTISHMPNHEYHYKIIQFYFELKVVLYFFYNIFSKNNNKIEISNTKQQSTNHMLINKNCIDQNMLPLRSFKRKKSFVLLLSQLVYHKIN